MCACVDLRAAIVLRFICAYLPQVLKAKALRVLGTVRIDPSLTNPTIGCFVGSKPTTLLYDITTERNIDKAVRRAAMRRGTSAPLCRACVCACL